MCLVVDYASATSATKPMPERVRIREPEDEGEGEDKGEDEDENKALLLKEYTEEEDRQYHRHSGLLPATMNKTKIGGVSRLWNILFLTKARSGLGIGSKELETPYCPALRIKIVRTPMTEGQASSLWKIKMVGNVL